MRKALLFLLLAALPLGAQIFGGFGARPGQVQADTFKGCSDAGSTDTYACNLTPALTTYTVNACYQFKANTANTGAASINFNGAGAKTIVKVAGGITTTLADNDIRVGQIVRICYDGTNMQMTSQIGNAVTGGTVTNTGTLTSDQPMFGNGTTDSKVGTKRGNTTQAQMTTGSVATDDCAKFDANGNIVSAGAACGTGSGSTEYNPLAYPGSPNAMDDEFAGSSLDAKWTEIRNTSPSITDTFNSPGIGFMKVTFGAVSQNEALLQAIPGGDWTFRSRCGGYLSDAAGYSRCTMVLYETAANTSKNYQTMWDTNNSSVSSSARTEYNTDISTFSILKGTALTGSGGENRTACLQIKKVSTNYTFAVSPDCLSWRETYSGTISEFTPGFIGMQASNGSINTTTEIYFDWFRRIN